MAQGRIHFVWLPVTALLLTGSLGAQQIPGERLAAKGPARAWSPPCLVIGSGSVSTVTGGRMCRG